MYAGLAVQVLTPVMDGDRCCSLKWKVHSTAHPLFLIWTDSVLPIVLAFVNFHSFSLNIITFYNKKRKKKDSLNQSPPHGPALHLGSTLSSLSWTATQVKYPTMLGNEQIHTCDGGGIGAGSGDQCITSQTWCFKKAFKVWNSRNTLKKWCVNVCLSKFSSRNEALRIKLNRLKQHFDTTIMDNGLQVFKVSSRTHTVSFVRIF